MLQKQVAEQEILLSEKDQVCAVGLCSPLYCIPCKHLRLLSVHVSAQELDVVAVQLQKLSAHNAALSMLCVPHYPSATSALVKHMPCQAV